MYYEIWMYTYLYKNPDNKNVIAYHQTCISPTMEAASAGDMFSEIEMEYTELTTWLAHTSKWLDTLHDPAKHGNISYEVCLT